MSDVSFEKHDEKPKQHPHEEEELVETEVAPAEADDSDGGEPQPGH